MTRQPDEVCWNAPGPLNIKEEDWDDIFNAYDKAGIKTTLGMERFLKANYNPPKKK